MKTFLLTLAAIVCLTVTAHSAAPVVQVCSHGQKIGEIYVTGNSKGTVVALPSYMNFDVTWQQSVIPECVVSQVASGIANVWVGEGVIIYNCFFKNLVLVFHKDSKTGKWVSDSFTNCLLQ